MMMNYNVFTKGTVKSFLESFYVSKKNIYKISNLNIYINNEEANINSLLNDGDILTIDFKETVNYKPCNKQIDVVYEDDYFLLINKEPLIKVHPNSLDEVDTLCNLVANYYLKKNISLNVRYIHRLDYETSGLICFVKDLVTESYMNHLFSLHQFERIYLGLVSGHLKNKSGYINKPIKEEAYTNRCVVHKNGKEALTYYEVTKEFKHYSLLEIKLFTGRTHQIRAHLKSINKTLVGDTLYGDLNKDRRVMLHAYSLSFYNPYLKKNVKHVASLKADFKELIK